jgi:hypothetical protein
MIPSSLPSGRVSGIPRPIHRGRFNYVLIHSNDVADEGRCHIFVGEDGVSILDPRSAEVTLIALDDIEHVEYVRSTFRRTTLYVDLQSGDQIQFTDTMSGTSAEALTNSLRPVIPSARPLPTLSHFDGLVIGTRKLRDTGQQRSEAKSHGLLLETDARKALGEPVESQEGCIFLGSVVPPDAPTGPAFQGFILVGNSKFCLVNVQRSTDQAWHSARFEDVTVAAYRNEHAGSTPDTYFFEIVSNRGNQPFLKRDGDYVEHLGFRVKAPGATVDSSVASLLLRKSKEFSRFDAQVGAEKDIEGLILMQLTPRVED